MGSGTESVGSGTERVGSGTRLSSNAGSSADQP